MNEHNHEASWSVVVFALHFFEHQLNESHMLLRLLTDGPTGSILWFTLHQNRFLCLESKYRKLSQYSITRQAMEQVRCEDMIVDIQHT